jgi:hypothetical protein
MQVLSFGVRALRLSFGAVSGIVQSPQLRGLELPPAGVVCLASLNWVATIRAVIGIITYQNHLIMVVYYYRPREPHPVQSASKC